VAIPGVRIVIADLLPALISACVLAYALAEAIARIA